MDVDRAIAIGWLFERDDPGKTMGLAFLSIGQLFTGAMERRFKPQMLIGKI